MTTEQQEHINAVQEHVQSQFLRERTGHDWWHMWRVWQMARHLQSIEGGDLYVIELGALLHDIADHKFYKGDRTVAPQRIQELLAPLGVSEDVITQIATIVPKVSYSGSGGKKNMDTLEGKIVQDADRLDAIGAIATARTFLYGGSKQHLMYVPKEDTESDAADERAQSCYQHFDDKLFKLKDLMNTGAAQKIAQERHEFMENFLKQFTHEWYYTENI